MSRNVITVIIITYYQSIVISLSIISVHPFILKLPELTIDCLDYLFSS